MKEKFELPIPCYLVVEVCNSKSRPGSVRVDCSLRISALGVSLGARKYLLESLLKPDKMGVRSQLAGEGCEMFSELLADAMRALAAATEETDDEEAVEEISYDVQALQRELREARKAYDDLFCGKLGILSEASHE